jgi:hypothetical protein
MRAAVKRQFDGIDANGKIAASGDIGGEPVTLPPGRYAVCCVGVKMFRPPRT